MSTGGKKKRLRILAHELLLLVKSLTRNKLIMACCGSLKANVHPTCNYILHPSCHLVLGKWKVMRKKSNMYGTKN
jgi:hypothetical protein